MVEHRDAFPRPEGSAPIAFVRTLVEEWRVVLWTPVCAAILVVVISFFLTPYFSASSSFVPEEDKTRLPTGLAGLAGQFGLDMEGGSSQSPQFYASVALSQSLLQSLLADSFTVHQGSKTHSGPLIDYLNVRGASEPIRIEKALKKLRKHLVTSVNRQTREVRITAESPYAEIAAGMANRLVAKLNEFNVTHRRTQGGARRQFVQQRLAQNSKDLQDAEDQYRVFLDKNRRTATWTGERFEGDRLQRQVQVLREGFLTLSRQLEEAQIQEVNETPVITTIDAAVVPASRSWPLRGRMAAVGATLGAIAGVFLALGRRYRATLEAEGDNEYRALVTAWRANLGRLFHRGPQRAA